MKNIIISLLVVIFFWYMNAIFFQQEKIAKPKNIPIESYYLGGIDGGVWVDRNKINDTIVYFLIYTDQGEFFDTCKVDLTQEIDSIITYEEDIEAFLLRNGDLIMCKAKEQGIPPQKPTD